MKKIRVKAIKVELVEVHISYDEYADDYFPLNGKTGITLSNSRDEFQLMEWMFEDENVTLRYDQIEVTEL